MIHHITEYIYGRRIYVQYINYVLVTFSILSSVTLSELAIKLVYLDALCLSSDYKEVSVLLCHSTERVAKTDIVLSLTGSFPSVAKCITYLACSTSIEKVSPAQWEISRTDCSLLHFPSTDTGIAEFCLKLWELAEQKERKQEGRTFKGTWLITRKAGSLQPLRFWKLNWTI